MRIRITFSKSGPMQYVGHLDLHRAWERTFRRSGLPLEYSLGFHPQPRLNLACALPVGFTSQCELLDAWLEHDQPVDHVVTLITAVLPPGLEISSIVTIDERQPALQTQVRSAIYTITFLDEIPDMIERIHKVEAAEKLPRVRREKPYDLRPLIESISPILCPEGRACGLRLQMAAREGATGRPEELLDAMGVRFENTHVHREQLILTPA
jgi:radical SAM-linked protein